MNMSQQPSSQPQWQQPQWQQQQQQPPQQWQQQRFQADLNRNYTAAAWLSAALVFLFWFPGAISIIIALREAITVKQRTGIDPQGYGCLWAVFLWCLAPLVVVLLILISIVLGMLHAGIGM